MVKWIFYGCKVVWILLSEANVVDIYISLFVDGHVKVDVYCFVEDNLIGYNILLPRGLSCGNIII